MKQRGYIITGFVFLIFFFVLILAIFYSQLATDKDDDIYHKINADKLYYITKNIDTLHDLFGGTPTDCETLMNNLTIPTNNGADLGVTIEYQCEYVVADFITYAKITKDDQSIYLDLG